MAISPPAGSDEQDGTDFLATQTVFGTGNRPAAGIDVLATKVALDFQALTSESGDNCVKRNLDALREATGVDAICIALFDPEKKVVERVASATGLFTPFDLPDRFRGRPIFNAEKCIGCAGCANNCPAREILVFDPCQEVRIIKYIGRRCTYCGRCADVCPEGAITMSQEYENGTGDIQDLQQNHEVFMGTCQQHHAEMGKHLAGCPPLPK